MGDVQADIGRLLARGVADGRHGFHTPAVATVGADGPACRLVVLRRWDAGARLIEFHTDRRAAKVAQIAARPAVALLFWDARARTQVRAHGKAALLTGAAAAPAWHALGERSRRTYRVTPDAGTVIPAADATTFDLDDAAGFANFVVARVTVTTLEWLRLDDGQERARFIWDGAEWRGTWLVP